MEQEPVPVFATLVNKKACVSHDKQALTLNSQL